MSRVELPPFPDRHFNVVMFGSDVRMWDEQSVRAYGIACAKAALEAAAQACRDAVDENPLYDNSALNAMLDCADAIRALAVGSGGSGA